MSRLFRPFFSVSSEADPEYVIKTLIQHNYLIPDFGEVGKKGRNLLIRQVRGGPIKYVLAYGLQLRHHWLCRRREIQPPSPAVIRIAPTLYKLGLLKPVDHAASRDRFDVNILRQCSLANAGITLQNKQHAPLRACRSSFTGRFGKMLAKQSANIGT